MSTRILASHHLTVWLIEEYPRKRTGILQWMGNRGPLHVQRRLSAVTVFVAYQSPMVGEGYIGAGIVAFTIKYNTDAENVEFRGQKAVVDPSQVSRYCDKTRTVWSCNQERAKSALLRR